MWLSDDTWSRLDPSAARLDPRGHVAMWVGLASGAVLAVLLVLGCTSGVLVPQLSLGSSWTARIDARTHSYVATTTVRNDGWFTERIMSVGARVRGVRSGVLRAVSVPAGGSGRLVVRITVTDCDTATGDDESPDHPVLRVRRPWGTVSATARSSNIGFGDPLQNGWVEQACRRS